MNYPNEIVGRYRSPAECRALMRERSGRVLVRESLRVCWYAGFFLAVAAVMGQVNWGELPVVWRDSQEQVR